MSGSVSESADGSWGRWDVGVKLSMYTCARGSRFYQRHILRDRRPSTSFWFPPCTVHTKFYKSAPYIYTTQPTLTTVHNGKTKERYTVKRIAVFPSPPGMSLIKLAGKPLTFFLPCMPFIYISHSLCERGAVMQSAHQRRNN
jgi:hypothetical protein